MLQMFPAAVSVFLSSDVDMEVDHFTNGVTESSSNGFLNGSSKHATEPEDCEADMGGWRLQSLLEPFCSALLHRDAVTCCRAKDAPVAVAEVESAQSKRQLCGGSQAAIERMIHFGRELQSMSEHLRRECGKNSANKKMLKVRPVNGLSRSRFPGDHPFTPKGCVHPSSLSGGVICCRCSGVAGRLQPAGLFGPLEQPGWIPAGRHSERARVLHPQQCNIR